MKIKWTSPVYFTDRKIKVIPLILGFVGVAISLYLGLAIGDRAAQSGEDTPEATAPLTVVPDEKIGISLGRSMWANYSGEKDPGQTTDPAASFDEVVRLASADLESKASSEEQLVDLVNLQNVNADFLALQGTSKREPDSLRLKGYGFASHNGTAVLWDEARWTDLDAGTAQLASGSGESGAATWVTLQSKTTKRQITVVSTQLAPLTNATAADPVTFSDNLAKLTKSLKGEVLIGVNLNIGYQSTIWNALKLSDKNLVPSYTSLGSLNTTSKNSNFPLDYVFAVDSSTVKPVAQRKFEQSGQHSAIIVEWKISSKLPKGVKPEGLVLAPR